MDKQNFIVVPNVKFQMQYLFKKYFARCRIQAVIQGGQRKVRTSIFDSAGIFEKKNARTCQL